MAVRVARGWAVAAAPCLPQTVDREAKGAPAIRSPPWVTMGDAAVSAETVVGLMTPVVVDAAAAIGKVARNVRRRMAGLSSGDARHHSRGRPASSPPPDGLFGPAELGEFGLSQGALADGEELVELWRLFDRAGQHGVRLSPVMDLMLKEMQ